MALIAIIGTGYVGLTTGACFAHIGHEVICVDIDEAKIAMLNEGRIPIHEEGLENIVREQLETGRLRFVTDTPSAVRDREFVYLCVPTPQGPDGSADMSYIDLAARQIAPALDARRGRRQQVDCARGIDPTRRASARSFGHRRRIESRVLA